MASLKVHASAVVIAESGVLLRGPSGAGKSSLALALIEKASLNQYFTALVGDDVIHLSVRHGRVVAEGSPVIAGLAERRGLGLVRVAALPRCIVRLVVDISASDEAPARMPEPDVRVTLCEGIALPTLTLTRSFSIEQGASLVLQALADVKAPGAILVDFP